jgi:predicted nucleotidyltransferase
MNLSHPAFDLLGENEGRVLSRLAVLADGTSGRRIHQLSGVGSLRTTQKILKRLVGTGLVDVRPAGPGNLYSLNRDHVLWGPIQQILETPATTEQHISRVLDQTLEPKMVGAALYGSFARGDASEVSDIDILVVWADDADDADRAEALDVAAQSIVKLTGNTPQFLPMTKNEISALVDVNDPLITSLRADGRSLTEGFNLQKTLVGTH